MTYRVQITEQAEKDLRGVFEYIVYELQSIQNATAQLSRLEERILKLNELPRRFPRYRKESWKSLDLHIMPVDNYNVFYIPNDTEKTVAIIRVMYGKRDTERHLND